MVDRLFIDRWQQNKKTDLVVVYSKKNTKVTEDKIDEVKRIFDDVLKTYHVLQKMTEIVV